MLRLARAALFAAVPAELLLVVLLVAGTPLPRPLVVAVETLVLAVLRQSSLIPPMAGIWPILGSMFMFRMMVYLHDMRTGIAPFGPWRALAYFFMLPNPFFPLFPLVDYKTFNRAYYNAERPHRALHGRAPLEAFNGRVKARPIGAQHDGHFRVREDRVSKGGNVTVRYLSRLRHIGVGRAYTGDRVKLLIADAHVRVVGADGSLLRELVIDPARDYQPRLPSSSIS